MDFKKILVTDNASRIGLGLLILRLSSGLMMMLAHGMGKLLNFSPILASGRFLPVLGCTGLGLGLDVFAEVFMSFFIIIGLFTRLAVIPLIITMLVALAFVHLHQPFAKMELAFLYLFPYIVLLIAGPGKFSADYYLAGQPGKLRKL